MKKKFICLFASIVMVGASVQAQEKRTCSTMENLERLKTLDPKLAGRMQEIENHTQQIVANRLAQGNDQIATVVNIPVVVHVVYNTTAQNISATQIQTQIDVLNEDFRKLNADRVNTPSVFASLAADIEVNFCLASTDPKGLATTGIVRKSTTATSFSDNDAVKHASSGGDDAWPTTSYLNLWVCNLGGGLLGYAQFPGGPAATDGVVINYKYFGRGTGTTAPYNKGRTATHEVGHWFNLYHIWGDDGTACTGSDNVSDTPNQGGEHYGCPSFPTSSCSNGANGDMFMNYMDYTDDGCMNMFSAGQKTRMRAVLASGGARYSLLSSTGCNGGTTTPPPPTTSSTTLTIGTGTSTMVAPYGTYYMDEKTQFIITKAELVAAGYSASNNSIKALAFNVASVSTQTMNGFSIKIRHTTSGAYTSSSYLSNTGMTTVYSGSTSVAATGWKTHTFTTPFTYNGIDNLLVEICWDNSSYTTDTKVYCTTQSTYKTIYKQQDVSAGGICATTTGTQTYARPNVRLTMGSASAAKLSAEEEQINDTPLSVFEIFPNPASTVLNVKYTTEANASNVTVIVYNLMGAVLSKTDIADLADGEHDLSIDLSALNNMPDGIYMLNLNVNGTNQTKRFILTH